MSTRCYFRRDRHTTLRRTTPHLLKRLGQRFVKLERWRRFLMSGESKRGARQCF
ncbi:hypothetical protein Arad_4813 [Rhizobium rhizogenes K84]|uniref:Uncharacterized protein n=1 Tax=Rhizobium rhizogenes (strain K84 / ATCC BAA-868) TaxID=311403 RepID=B9JE87_RHIR8|nr:hypothetical protein Arad_4813 [Rhizobium rhizogenes K84]